MLNKIGLALAVVLVFTVFAYPIQYAEARNMVIEDECTSEGWLVVISDTEGNPLPNVRILTVEGMRSSGYEESFSTDINGTALIPFPSITGFIKISKGGYSDQTLSMSCEPPTDYAGKLESGFLRYSDPLYGISMDYPPTWTIDKSDPNLLVKLVSPQESYTDLYLETVGIVALNVEFDNPAELANSYLSFASTNMQGFQLLENIPDTIGGQSAQKIIFIGSMQGIEAKVLAYYTIVDSVGYVFIFDAEPTNYQRYLPIFEQMIESVSIKSKEGSEKIQEEISDITVPMPQIISGKYVNSDVGMEIEFPSDWTGFEIAFPKDVDFSELELSTEMQSMMEIYSGMTVVTMLPNELDPTGNIKTTTLTVMEASSIYAFSDFISQAMESTKLSFDEMQEFSTEYQPECDISNQTILEINKMKAIRINSECKDSTQNMAFTMSIYMFMTPDHIISPMYMTTHEIGGKGDLSIFENSLNTLKIKNTINISDPYSYAESFGLEVIKENIMIDNKPHEIKIVSDAIITNFSFDETNHEISFESKGDSKLASTEIYLDNVLVMPFTVTIDDVVDNTFMITEDTTTGQTSISISYIHPVEKISIKGNKPNTIASNPIPDWIRNNASWWVEGRIDDSAFVGGIQFLIKEGIMQIPETAQSTMMESQDIPSWIKNNADWWSQGLISDDDFLKGIQFMVENGIIVV